jgi:drug/metabolite transporter (DMT)-like permease
MQHESRMTVVEWGLLLLLSVLWGGSFFFSKVALQELPPFTLVLARVGIAAIALRIYLRARHLPIPRSFSIWAAFAGMGLLNNLIPFALIFWGQTTIASGLASILNATTPIFSILIAHLLTTDERMTQNRVAGILLGLAGVVAVVGTDALAGAGRSTMAILACLGAALSYGFASVFGRRFKRMGIAPAVSAFGQVASTTIMVVPIILVFDAPWRLGVPSIATWSAVVGLALLSTALAYVIFFRVLASAGVTNISLVTLLIPVSAILLGSLILGERLSTSQLVGMAFIALGLIAIDGRAWQAARCSIVLIRPR